MFRSALFKLTAAYVGMVMAICIAFSAALYRLAVQELHTGFYNQYALWFNAYEPFGLRQPGSPVHELAARSHHIFSQILYLDMLVLLITTVASYLLARRTLRPIEASHVQQKRFTADVSHELRTPLTSLKMETELALFDPKTRAPQLRETLRSNMEDVDPMEALINNLLLLSTIEADKLRSNFNHLDIQTVVSEAVDTVSKSAALRKITISQKLVSKKMPGDQASLTQLFVILLDNAIKYSPDGSEITVGILRGRGRVIVDIQDRGAGIESDTLPHIFNRFYRGDSARGSAGQNTSDKPGGFGLGLSIAKLIADLHHGEIIISSTPGSGTSASVILPTSNHENMFKV